MIGGSLAGKDPEQRAAKTVRQQSAVVFKNGFDGEVRRWCGTFEAENLAGRLEEMEAILITVTPKEKR